MQQFVKIFETPKIEFQDPEKKVPTVSVPPWVVYESLPCPLTNLPSDLVLHICNFLPAEALLQVRLASRTFYEFTEVAAPSEVDLSYEPLNNADLQTIATKYGKYIKSIRWNAEGYFYHSFRDLPALSVLQPRRRSRTAERPERNTSYVQQLLRACTTIEEVNICMPYFPALKYKKFSRAVNPDTIRIWRMEGLVDT
jgi:hypothetical protein